MIRTYSIKVNGQHVASMTADFAQAASQLTLDGDSTPYQVADARHRPQQAAEMLLEWARNDVGFSFDPDGEITVSRPTICVEYSLDSLGDISPDAFESACQSRAETMGCDVEFVVGLNDRETMFGEPVDLIVEHAFAECCG